MSVDVCQTGKIPCALISLFGLIPILYHVFLIRTNITLLVIGIVVTGLIMVFSPLLTLNKSLRKKKKYISSFLFFLVVLYLFITTIFLPQLTTVWVCLIVFNALMTHLPFGSGLVMSLSVCAHIAVGLIAYLKWNEMNMLSHGLLIYLFIISVGYWVLRLIRILKNRDSLHPSDCESLCDFSFYPFMLTENKKLSDDAILLDSVLNSISDIISLQDNHHRIIRYNQAGYDYLGMNPQQAIGKQCYDLLGQELECQNCPTRKAFETGEPARTVRFYPESGKWWDIRSYPVHDRDGKLYRMVEHIRDVTDYKNTQLQLIEQKNLFQAIYEHSPLGMVIMTDDYRLQEVNNVLCKIVGLSHDEIIGQDYQAICDPESYESDMDYFSLLKEKHLTQVRFESVWMNRENEQQVIKLYANYIKDIEDQPRFFILQAENITYRKKTEAALQESEYLYRLLVENTSDLIALMDPDGEIIYTNRVMTELFGSKQTEMGKSFYNLIHREDRDIMKNTISNYINNHIDNVTLEMKMLSPEKNLFYLMWNINFIVDSSGKFPEYIMGIGADITGRIEWQNQLENYNNLLKEKNDELKHYAYTVSHDLKEPLRMVSNYIGLIQKRIADKGDNDLNEFLHYAKDGAERMQVFITDLLDHTRLNSSPLKIIQVNMNDVIRLIKHNLTLFIEEKNAVIESDDLPLIHADSRLITSLFQNIIINAVKYHKPNLPPIVKIKYEYQNGYHIFSIQDNGVGIPIKYHRKIFEMFQRVPSPIHRSGTGVGLATCMKIVERHRGTIFLDSTPDIGSTFIISLPENPMQSY